jgi:hypothetical protein
MDDRNGEPLSSREARRLLAKKMLAGKRSRQARQAEVEVPYVVWKQRDGTPILVRDMDDHHLYCTIRMLEKNADARVQREKEDQFSADPDDVFYELTREQCLNNHPVYLALVKVAEARGIDLFEYAKV